jgi:inner membrane protein
MTTPLGHGLFALALYLAAPGREPLRRLLFFALLFIAAMAPDMDYFPILWGDFRLANLNHQGFTHSLVFCLLIAVPLAYIGKWLGLGRARSLYPWLAAAALSHLLLDFFTFDGREPFGVPLLWPLSDTRFTSGISLFGGVIKGSVADLFSLHNARVMLNEILWLGIPVLLLWLYGRRQRRIARPGVTPRSGTGPR